MHTTNINELVKITQSRKARDHNPQNIHDRNRAITKSVKNCDLWHSSEKKRN